MTENEFRELKRKVKENKILTFWQRNYIIQALEEIQQYRAIGTPEECRVAADRMKSSKPSIWGDGYADDQLVYDSWDCPNCGKTYELDCDEHDYCPNCGQHIDWSE